MKLTKDDLIDRVAENVRHRTPKLITKQTVELVVNRLFYELNHAFVNKDKVMVNNFGLFWPIKRQHKVGRNPQTGKLMHIPSHWTVKFKPSGNVLRLFNP